MLSGIVSYKKYYSSIGIIINSKNKYYINQLCENAGKISNKFSKANQKLSE
jgi:hypothetical protein